MTDAGSSGISYKSLTNVHLFFLTGTDNFQSRVKLRFFWCNLCPFDTESKASLLQHMVSQHCFMCRHCPYMALSRCDVVQHSLSHHPQFQQQVRAALCVCVGGGVGVCGGCVCYVRMSACRGVHVHDVLTSVKCVLCLYECM